MSRQQLMQEAEAIQRVIKGVSDRRTYEALRNRYEEIDQQLSKPRTTAVVPAQIISMACPKCGKAASEYDTNKWSCLSCGNKFIYEPSREIFTSGAVMGPVTIEREYRAVAAVLAILFGAFGAHKFYLGYIREGVITLIFDVIGLGPLMVVIGWIEAWIYLCKTKEQFNQIYVSSKKGWF